MVIRGICLYNIAERLFMYNEIFKVPVSRFLCVQFVTLANMAKDLSNEIVLSYYDCLLRAADVALLQGSYWLNDIIIGFYFEYLDKKFNKNEKKELYFVSPELTQLLKMSDPSQYDIFLDPTVVSDAKCIFFPLNNCDSKVAAGGSHWSLLIYCKQDKTCYHFDSSRGINKSIASEFATNVMKSILDKKEPNKKFVETDCPQQDNGYDCGVYVLCLADAITEHFMRNGKVSECDYSQVKKSTRTKRMQLFNLINELKHKSSNEN